MNRTGGRRPPLQQGDRDGRVSDDRLGSRRRRRSRRNAGGSRPGGLRIQGLPRRQGKQHRRTMRSSRRSLERLRDVHLAPRLVSRRHLNIEMLPYPRWPRRRRAASNATAPPQRVHRSVKCRFAASARQPVPSSFGEFSLGLGARRSRGYPQAAPRSRSRRRSALPASPPAPRARTCRRTSR
jgi:hypothetical protein